MRKRITGITTTNGKRWTARRYISNADPRLTARLAGLEHLDRDRRDYPYEDINRIYDDQLVRHDLSNPWLFLSTPTLHSSAPGLCPPGDQILEVATACDYTRFATLRTTDRRANLEKKKIRERILDVLDAHYVPNIRKHLVMRVTGTPATNARFVRAPEGNSYGSALTPKNVGAHRKPFQSSLENLWLANAAAGFPGVAGAIAAGIHLYEDLTGDHV